MDRIERLNLLSKAKENIDLQAVLMEKCRRDIIFWICTFVWTFDPRKEPAYIPFQLYPYQQWAIKELCKAIEEQYDLGIEKSRDMGVSWIIAVVFLWYWLFHDGYNFHCGSRTEAEVDLKGDHRTIFEKMRIVLQWLPKWMVPEGYDVKKNALHLRLINPVRGNVISGEACCPQFARGGRFRAILYDEFAFWNYAESSWASGAQSTNCRIPNSTPYGNANKQARLMKEAEVIPYEEVEASLDVAS